VKFIEPITSGPTRRKRYYQYTAIDDCTRLRVLRIYPRSDQKTAIQFFDYVTSRLPFVIEQVQTDNGAEFQSGFHWHLLDRGIGHRYIRPATPRLNGKVERSHRIDAEEFYRLLDGAIVDDTGLFNDKLPSGQMVLGLADVVVLNDPITGQGSNNAGKCAASYLASIVENGDAPYDRTFMQDTFERYYEYAQYVTTWTNAFLTPPPPMFSKSSAQLRATKRSQRGSRTGLITLATSSNGSWMRTRPSGTSRSWHPDSAPIRPIAAQYASRELSMRRIVIVGAGQAGAQLAIGLLSHSYDVTLISDRSSDDVRNGPVLSSQCMFESSLQHERDLGLNLRDEHCPRIDGIGMSFPGSGADQLSWSAPLNAPAQSVDQRLKLSAWLDLFVESGGQLTIRQSVQATSSAWPTITTL
jgi:hypothetical protein